MTTKTKLTMKDIADLQLEYFRTADYSNDPFGRLCIGLQMLDNAFKYLETRRGSAVGAARLILRRAKNDVFIDAATAHNHLWELMTGR